MTQSASVYSLTSDLTSDLKPGRRWGFWVIVVLLVLLIHFLFFMTHVDWGTPKAPPRVDVEQVDPQKLEQIRRHWRDQEKSLLLNKNQPRAEKAPDNARYMSDRNIRVEKEQRAREHVIQPKPGAHTQTHENAKPQQAQPQTQAQAQSKAHGIPNLGNLGVPFRLNEKANQQARKAQSPSSPMTTPGGEQYVDDKNVPIGSENLLNAEESVYYSFYARLYDAIGPIWASRLRELSSSTRVNPGDYTTAVDVVLDREGNLVEVRLLQSSQVRAFDEAVNTSWARIGKFPNPPVGLVKEDGKVHTGWNFTVQVGGGGAGLMLMPPERTN
jgi:outer membrane biosynthesis protein TonB